MPTIDELASQVAALEQQMAAIITPPDKYYTSIYSGEEIDAAITKVRAGAIGVSSFNGRTGAVLPQAGDYNATQIPVSADAGAETVAAALNNKPNCNLLDNWYFVGGGMTGKFPVNQRGLTSYGPTTANYNSIDRWLVNSGTMSPETDGLNLTGPGIIIQRFENLDLSDGEYVFSCLTAGGCFSAPLTDHYVACGPFNVTRDTSTDNLYVSFQSTTSVKLKAVKLERGTTQTLAHQDEDGNWVLNEIPDYGEELAKCQRYCYVLDGSPNNPQFRADVSAGRLIGEIPFPVTMRTTPSVSMFPLTLRYTTTGATIVVSSAQLFVTNAGLSLIYQIQVSEGGPLVDGDIYSPNSKIIFSADL